MPLSQTARADTSTGSWPVGAQGVLAHKCLGGDFKVALPSGGKDAEESGSLHVSGGWSCSGHGSGPHFCR